VIYCCIDSGFVEAEMVNGGVGVSSVHFIWIFGTSTINDGLSGSLIFSNNTGLCSSSKDVGCVWLFVWFGG